MLVYFVVYIEDSDTCKNAIHNIRIWVEYNYLECVIDICI